MKWLCVFVTGCWLAPSVDVPADREWRQVATTDGPPGLHGPRGTYDAKNHRVVIYGGRLNSGTDVETSAEMWAWDGTRWERLCGACMPGGRRSPAFAYDSRRDVIVLAGGSTATELDLTPGALDSVFEFDGEWHPAAPLPEPRAGAHFVDDTARKTLVLVGGSNTNGAVQTVYDYDGEWRPRMVMAGPQSGGNASSVTFDPDRDRILAFSDSDERNDGVNRDELWALASNSAGWTKICGPCDAVPRRAASLVYVPTDARLYSVNGFAGDELRGTQRFFDGGWVSHDAVLPPKRDSSAVVYDPDRDVVVLYGGNGDSCSGNCNDTWELARPTSRRAPSPSHD